MAIENEKLLNLEDAQVLYNDLRNRHEHLNDDVSDLKNGIDTIKEAYEVDGNELISLEWYSGGYSWDKRDTANAPRQADGYQAAKAVAVLPGVVFDIKNVHQITGDYKWGYFVYNSDFSQILDSSGAVEQSGDYDYTVTIPTNGAWLCINCNSGTVSVAENTTLQQVGKVLPKMSDVLDSINGKITKPSSEGTEGQVLTLDNNLTPVWQTPSGGGADIDDDAGAGVLNKTWSANKLSDIQGMLVLTSAANNVTEWEQGGLTPTTGAISSSSSAIRTKGRIGTEHGDIICASGYVMNIYCYNDAGEYLGVYKKNTGTIVKDYIAWYDSANLQTIANGNRYTFQIVVKLDSGSSIVPSAASNVTIKTIVTDKLSNGVDDINASALLTGNGSIIDGFIFGTINGANGQLLSANDAIRSMKYLPDGVQNIETSGNYVFYIFAYEKETGEYIGAWDKATKTFKKSIEVWYNNLIMTDLQASDYDLRMAVKKSNGATFEITDAIQNLSIVVDNIKKMENGYKWINKKDSLESQSDAISASRTTSVWETGAEYVPPLTLLHFSDIHNDVANYLFIVNFMKNHVGIDDVLNTGDFVGSYYDANQVKAYFSVFDADNYALLALGNHEYYTSNDYSTKMAQASAYGYYIAPTIEAWGAEYTENKTYWYKDYEDSGVRLIGIDNMLEGSDMTAQVSWLEGVLADARTNDFAVVIAGHCPPTTQTGTKITSSFTSFQNIPESSDINALDENGTGIQAAVDDFMEAGGEFVCYLMGHYHYDFIMYSSTYPNQLIIDIGTAAHNEGANSILSGAMRRDEGTPAQNLFNIFTVDRTDGLVRLVRIGADRDMYMKPRRVLCYDYKNHSLIYSE